MKIMSPKPMSIEIRAANERGLRCVSSHRQTGRKVYARMNAARKGVKISAIVCNPLEFNDSTDPVVFFTKIPTQI